MLSQFLDRFRLRGAGKTVDDPETSDSANRSLFLPFSHQLLDLLPRTVGLLLQLHLNLLAVLRTGTITMLSAKRLMISRPAKQLILHAHKYRSQRFTLQRDRVVDFRIGPLGGHQANSRKTCRHRATQGGKEGHANKVKLTRMKASRIARQLELKSKYLGSARGMP